MPSTVLSTGPTVEPVTLVEVKEFLRIDTHDEDDLLEALITTARQMAEHETGRAMLEQTWVRRLDGFADEMILPNPPLRSVTSVVYLDSAGVTQTVSTALYDVDTYSTPGRIRLGYEDSWPTPRDVPNNVTITYKAGYGTTATTVPQALRSAVKLLVGHLYENREPFVVGQTVNEVPLCIKALLWQHKVASP